jgi:hypothetical protein
MRMSVTTTSGEHCARAATSVSRSPDTARISTWSLDVRTLTMPSRTSRSSSAITTVVTRRP